MGAHSIFRCHIIISQDMANLLVPDVEWWVMACGGATYCIPKVGLYMICFARKAKHIVLEDPDVCECIYLKYMHNVEGMGRNTLFMVLGFLKRYPKQVVTVYGAVEASFKSDDPCRCIQWSICSMDLSLSFPAPFGSD